MGTFKQWSARFALLLLVMGVITQTPAGAAFAQDTTATTTAPNTTDSTAPVAPNTSATPATTVPAKAAASTTTTPTTKPPKRQRTTTTLAPTPTTVAAPTPTTVAAPTGATTSLILKLKPGLSKSAKQTALTSGGGALKSDLANVNVAVVSVPTGQVATSTSKYKANKNVLRVEQSNTRKIAGAASDPEYAQQWALPKIGWDSVHGAVNPSGAATIAVLDTGVDGTHPDLAGRLVPGWSAFAGSNPATDPNGHGTALAGIAAAVTDNNAGIAGVGYAGVSIMPVQVLGADGTGQDADIITGITAAADSGAKVILMGFSNPGFSQSLQDAVDYAWSKGAVVVAATGNDASSAVTSPAGDAKVVGVSATDQNDALWSGSNSGQDTFIAAPGVGIAALALGGGTSSITGTSASAAVVAGSAALLRANDPGASNATVVGRLARNADPAGTTDQTGNGRVNLARAIGDSGTAGVTPAGAAPVGAGGPLVGPYQAAA